MISKERVKELLHYEPSTGIFTWKISRGTAKKGSEAGHLHFKGYIRIKLDKTVYLSHRLAFIYMGKSLPREVDHIDHNRSNNKWSNLREATTQENSKNSGKYKTNTSGSTGVYWHKRDQTWTSAIGVDGKLKHLGSFNTKQEAINSRKLAEIHHGFHTNHGT